ncbi:MAG: MBL fold metallo-hydrolase [Acidobacteria bacterium]|nr:MAG: MBL fold metallo-hydrolase [Acidobacteriota bacterium]REK09242.1 MAG: MBL fold metallo-hydrolase [Acidobacteriota bacterium]
MLFRQIFDPDLAQYAYLIGCQKTGEALVIDPERDVDRYLELAEREGLRLTAVAETHIHADFLSGARELARRHGVRAYLSDEGPAEWKSEWARRDAEAVDGSGPIDVVFLKGGDTFRIGKIEVQAVHTPGHTPEHISFLVTDRGGGADSPIGLATGDFVFVGDLGRPDLLESAAGQAGAMGPAAHQLFESLPSFLALDDSVQVWPAHGAGSACGKALGAVPTSTVGYERRYNAAIRHSQDGEQAFVDFILEGQPEPPLYFARMKRLNKEGPEVLGELPRPAAMAPGDLLSARDVEGGVILDTRGGRGDFVAGHLAGSLHAPLGSGLSNVAGSYVEEDVPIFLVADEDDVEHAVRQLVRIGLDDVRGYLTPAELHGAAAGQLSGLATTDFEGLVGRVADERGLILDVRGLSEFEQAHLPGARQIAYTRLATLLDDLPRDRRLYVHCASGRRASFAASELAREGFDVVLVDDLFEHAEGLVRSEASVVSEA